MNQGEKIRSLKDDIVRLRQANNIYKQQNLDFQDEIDKLESKLEWWKIVSGFLFVFSAVAAILLAIKF